MSAAESNTTCKSTWAVPTVCAITGLAYLFGGLAGGQTTFGIFGLILMWGLGIVLLLVRNRSETVKGLMDQNDERITAMDLRATATAGAVVVIVVIVAFVVDIARGGDGMPYAWIGAAGGLAYLVAIVWQRLRG